MSNEIKHDNSDNALQQKSDNKIIEVVTRALEKIKARKNSGISFVNNGGEQEQYNVIADIINDSLFESNVDAIFAVKDNENEKEAKRDNIRTEAFELLLYIKGLQEKSLSVDHDTVRNLMKDKRGQRHVI